PVELRYYLVSAHYRSVLEYSEEALAESATAYSRIEGFVERATEVTGGVDPATGIPCAEFTTAMDDDLAVPAALAAVQSVIRDGNKLLADGDSAALRGNLASVRRMLDVLGLDPLSPVWGAAAPEAGAERTALDVLVRTLVQHREAARAAKDFATADAVRDQLSEAGTGVEDTPSGPRWTLTHGATGPAGSTQPDGPSGGG